MTDYVADNECPHGRPRDDTTNAGLPKCQPCRKREMYQLRSKGRRPARPRMTQPTLLPRK